MKNRLALLFPYLFALAVLAIFVWGRSQSSLTITDDPTIPNAGQMPDQSMADADTPAFSAQIDPVCHMEVGKSIETQYRGISYYFCATYCRELFNKTPEDYLTATCQVCRAEGVHTPLPESTALQSTWQGKTYRLCSPEHLAKFRQDPGGYFMHSMWGIPPWLYYSSIALTLLLSFAIIEWRERRSAKGAAPPAPPRINLLAAPRLRALIVHPRTRFAAQIPIVLVFLLILAAGLFGNQLPGKNIAPLVTWTIWWGGLIALILYAGKAWCYVCPWDAIAGWTKGLSLNLPWPRLLRNIWPATFLFIGLTWIELGFGVTMNPRVTAWLGLAMLSLAFGSALIFDRKSFCRYGCLVGRISGLYALFAPIEIRSHEKSSCRSCTTSSCYKGNDKGQPCPTFEHLGSMNQNTYCIACMECVKSCEKHNVALNLRPWGADLQHHKRPRADEAYLSLLMLSLTGFHGLTMTAAWHDLLAWIEQTTHIGQTAAFTLGMTAIMIAPGLLYAALVFLSHRMAHASDIPYRDYFIRYAYALLPIALFYHLAHNSEHFLMEGQKIIALASDPFGSGVDWFGTARWKLPPLVDLPTLWIVQVLFVMVGHIYSLVIARRTAAALFADPATARRSQWIMLLAMILFSLMSLWLLKQPMEMRTSAM